MGGYNWRLLCFPKGNNSEHLSVYLDVADSERLPPGWTRYANFELEVKNRADPQNHFAKDANHTFCAKESDWGFTQFFALGDLTKPGSGYLEGDLLEIECRIDLRKLEPLAYDSRNTTGHVGLKNQGATCYMNSLLQTLFHLPYFRKAVFQMPIAEGDVARNIPLALQGLFYKLQYSPSAVATKDLTKSFGWDTMDAFTQHDVQELNRVLCEKLEEKMKGTPVEDTIQVLFEGHVLNFIECKNVDYKSTRKESYMDLQLDVKGCKNVYESFDKYVEVETLDGQNQYRAEGFGLQDARKGILFESFPPVLQLQLKRFEYDFMRDAMVKVNERYEFPLELDLDRENGRYLTSTADRGERNLYTLHGVLVHSGGVHGGHYYAFIRPDGKQWLKFDDEKVTKVDTVVATEEQFGGDPNGGRGDANSGDGNDGNDRQAGLYPTRFARHSSAYMLVYVRNSRMDKVFTAVDKMDVDERVRAHLDREAAEKQKRRREKQEAHLFTTVRLATENTLKEQVGRASCFDLINFEDGPAVHSFRVPKSMTFEAFKAKVFNELRIPASGQRYWFWSTRENRTYRPSKALTREDESLAIGDIREPNQASVSVRFLNLFLEVPLPPSPLEGPLPLHSYHNFLLFFKFYDPQAQPEPLQYVGRLLVPLTATLAQILPDMLQLAGLPPETPVDVFEEVAFEPKVNCPQLDLTSSATLRDLSIESGDIICFQRALAPPPGVVGVPNYSHPRLDVFLTYTKNRQVVRFRRHPGDAKALADKGKGGSGEEGGLSGSGGSLEEQELSIELSKEDGYDSVVAVLAERLGEVNVNHIRITAHNSFNNGPKPQAISHQGFTRLQDVLTHFQSASDILYYEVLDMPVYEAERLKTLRVSFHNDRTQEVGTHQIRLPKDSTVQAFLLELRRRVEQAEQASGGAGNSQEEASQAVSSPPFLPPPAPPSSEEEGTGGEGGGRGMRLLEVFYNKIYKTFAPDDTIEAINDQYWELRGEFIPEEEKSAGPNDRLVHVHHFTTRGEATQPNSNIQCFGDPFLLLVREDEPLSSVRDRVQQKLRVPDEDFQKWKFAFVSSGPPEYLEDLDTVAAKFPAKKEHSSYSGWDSCFLGLEHEDKNPRKAANSTRYGYEKPIKIYS